MTKTRCKEIPGTSPPSCRSPTSRAPSCRLEIVGYPHGMSNKGGWFLVSAEANLALVVRIFDPFSEENTKAT